MKPKTARRVHFIVSLVLGVGGFILFIWSGHNVVQNRAAGLPEHEPSDMMILILALATGALVAIVDLFFLRMERIELGHKRNRIGP